MPIPPISYKQKTDHNDKESTMVSHIQHSSMEVQKAMPLFTSVSAHDRQIRFTSLSVILQMLISQQVQGNKSCVTMSNYSS